MGKDEYPVVIRDTITTELAGRGMPTVSANFITAAVLDALEQNGFAVFKRGAANPSTFEPCDG